MSFAYLMPCSRAHPETSSSRCRYCTMVDASLPSLFSVRATQRCMASRTVSGAWVPCAFALEEAISGSNPRKAALASRSASAQDWVLSVYLRSSFVARENTLSHFGHWHELSSDWVVH